MFTRGHHYCYGFFFLLSISQCVAVCLSFLISISPSDSTISSSILSLSSANMPESWGFTAWRSPAASHISHLDYVLCKARGCMDTALQHSAVVTNQGRYWPAGGDANSTHPLAEGGNKSSTRCCSFSPALYIIIFSVCAGLSWCKKDIWHHEGTLFW